MGQRSVIHDFEEKLDKSNESVDWLGKLYHQIFPNLLYEGIEYYPKDMEKQKQGIDVELFLTNGHVIKMDEKRRYSTYPDIALEYISVDTNNTPGWIEKDLRIDYLSYIFMPIKLLHLFPWILLRRAWRRNGEAWKKIYKCFPAQNKNYNTWSVGVPPDILWRAISEVSFCRL